MKRYNKYILIIVLQFSGLNIFAQIGGTSTYNFLELSTSARVAALGGTVNAINDNDLSLSYNNPALLNSAMDNNMVINYVNYFTDINYGYISYAREISNKGMFAGGLQYINYGKFIAANEKGVVTGNFHASEYAFNLIYSRPILDSVLFLGINTKPILSTLESYTSFGLAADFGLLYVNTSKDFTAAFVVKNLGIQFKTYASTRESLPFNIQLGISKKLSHAPFRFSVVLDHLETPDLTYENPNNEASELDPLIGDDTKQSNIDKYSDMFMRHLILGIEFIPVDNLFIRAGYNYRRRKELLIESKTSTVGFSFGFGIKISDFYLNYGRSTYHLAGATDNFSISTNLSRFYK
ncbi:MAG: type IX secretion system protein PorQ [Bacteroidales bacterium]|jgi:hypothetical protein|nr:type IX secretion system protein PorQ [Bacteroidales bacterium]